MNTLSEEYGTLFVIAAGNSGDLVGDHRVAGQRGRSAHRRCGRPAGRGCRILQPWPQDRRRRAQARPHRAGRGHRCGPCRRHRDRRGRRRAVRDLVRHLHGDAPRRRGGRDPAAATSDLDSEAGQVRADGIAQERRRRERVRPGRGASRPRGSHRPVRHGRPCQPELRNRRAGRTRTTLPCPGPSPTATRARPTSRSTSPWT